VGEPIDLLGQPVTRERFDGLHDPRVQRAAPVVEQTAVRHLVGQRVLERQLKLRKQAPLVEELGGLELRQAVPQLVIG
jgi:hypothetical protein